ncbi:DUF6030 family protein [Jiella pacifica]|uniref:Uncharacterized protein n=1 Tax=Jiella pacifica TaxID=2696469 RepID=A0A6N9SVI2_9HYPH|nr:DUF6030 family protein [Jiella pacifica]NDW03053.1 hypothetical protein [Jiella pacifica]
MPRGTKRERTTWEAPISTSSPAEKGFDVVEVLGLVTRLGLVALVIAGGLIVVFLNSDAGGSLGERFKRAAETGAVFSQPARPEASGNVERDPAAGDEASTDKAEAQTQVAVIGSPRLLTPPATRAAPQLVRLALVSPKKICKAIDPGTDFMSWHESLLLDGQWECYATATAEGERVEREDTGESEEDALVSSDPDAVVEPALPSQPQLFVMARGDQRDTLTTVRVKLVADSAAKAKRGARRIAEITGALFDVLQWRAPDGLLEKLEGLTDFDLEQAGTQLRFKRELSTGWQYNLIVIFPNPKIYSQGSAFHPPETTSEAGPPGPAELSGSTPVSGNDR